MIILKLGALPPEAVESLTTKIIRSKTYSRSRLCLGVAYTNY